MFARVLSLLALLVTPLAAVDHQVDANSIRADIEFLASDALRGRQSASPDELIAAVYIASQLRQVGVQPAGSDGSYIQPVTIPVQAVKSPPSLRVGDLMYTHGKEVAFGSLGTTSLTGPLQKFTVDKPVKPGAVVYVALRLDKDAPPVRDQITGPLRAGAGAVLIGFSEERRDRFQAAAKDLPQYNSGAPTFVLLDQEASNHLAGLADGTPVSLQAQLEGKPPIQTRNVIGVLPGKTDEVILLSAHMDHLGTKSGAGDTIYNGADDDASGVTAVLELARALAHDTERRRTVYFLFTGSEELGLLGGTYFIQHPPIPPARIIANLEFEMIGRPDPKIAPKTLWLTGFDRSDLGPELAKHGARLVADPRPDQQFFQRSDNYALAKKGVVAHTVSSFGLHPQYHQPDDDLAHIDFAHMTEAIQSLVAPVEWLVNSDFKPQWLPGKKP